MSILYNRMAALCKAKGISVSAMCKKAGVSTGSISELKSGRRESITIKTAEKIATALDVTVDALLGSPSGVSAVFELGDLPIDFNNLIMEQLRELGIPDEQIAKNTPKTKEGGIEVRGLSPSEARIISETIVVLLNELIRERRNKGNPND